MKLLIMKKAKIIPGPKHTWKEEKNNILLTGLFESLSTNAKPQPNYLIYLLRSQLTLLQIIIYICLKCQKALRYLSSEAEHR